MTKLAQDKYGYDFEKVYTEFYPRLRRFVRNYTRSGVEADNILQDIFAELWENWEVHSRHRNIFGYLFISARNRCVDFLRREQQRIKAESKIKQHWMGELQLNISALDSLEVEESTLEEIETIVLKAIESLPEKCREIFIMNKIQGKKQKQIAEELNISVNTVETQMSIAYRKLRQELGALFPLVFLFFSFEKYFF